MAEQLQRKQTQVFTKWNRLKLKIVLRVSLIPMLTKVISIVPCEHVANSNFQFDNSSGTILGTFFDKELVTRTYLGSTFSLGNAANFDYRASKKNKSSRQRQSRTF